MQQHLLMAQCDGSNILNWQVYHMCIHIKIKSPPAILHHRGVCVCMGEDREQCCRTSCLLIGELPRNAGKK